MKKLYLDDERTPHPSHGFDIVRNYAEFVDYIITNGIPDVISFDHDLGENHYMLKDDQWTVYPELVEKGEVDTHVFGETGYDIAKWLVEYCEEHNLKLKETYVHSMNVVGANNIISLLNPFYQRKGIPIRCRKGDLCLKELIKIN